MLDSIKKYIEEKGYTIDTDALQKLRAADEWYRGTASAWHKREGLQQGSTYTIEQLLFGKRLAADEAAFVELLEINADNTNLDALWELLDANRLISEYRKQAEETAALGTTAAYISYEGADELDNGAVSDNGRLCINYVEALSIIPLSVVRGIITEVAFVGQTTRRGAEFERLIMFTLNENGTYHVETTDFDKQTGEPTEQTAADLGEVKPFAIMRCAEVNSLAGMDGYGLPKIYTAIPYLKGLDAAYTVLLTDAESAEKITIIDEALTTVDDEGNAYPPSDALKNRFVKLDALPSKEGGLVVEINPKIRIAECEQAIEFLLSMASLQFGFGAKKYRLEAGQITTATEYIGERQDAMQALNKQREEARQYIAGICDALNWFSATYTGRLLYPEGTELTISFDDSFIEDTATKLERMRNDCLSFGNTAMRIQYLMQQYHIDEETARAWLTPDTEEDKTPEFGA